jgi:hypothetical protein
MKVVKIILPVFLIGIIALVWLAPLGPLPGFFIGGTAAEVPEEWQDTSNLHEIELEVKGTLPRVVVIWVVQVDGDLYVVGAKNSGWVQMLGNGGPVRMRMGDKTYALNAGLVTTDWEVILDAYTNKYRADYPDIVDSFPELEEAGATTSVFRIFGE